MLEHLVGQQAVNTVESLKEQLGVERLDLVLMDSMEEFYAHVPFLAPPEKERAPENPPA